MHLPNLVYDRYVDQLRGGGEGEREVVEAETITVRGEGDTVIEYRLSSRD